MREACSRIALALVFSAAALHAQDIADATLMVEPEPQLEMGSVFPSELPAGVPTSITVTARVTDIAVAPENVGLFQVDAAGNTLSRIGSMVEQGPLVDNARIFTGRLTITLPPAGGGIQPCVMPVAGTVPVRFIADRIATAQNPPPVKCYPPLIFPFPLPLPPIGVPGAPPPVIPTMEILDVSFEDDIGILKDGAAAAALIVDPVWRKARQNIVARNEPGAYAGGKNMKATILIKLNPAPILPIMNATFAGTIAGFAGKLEARGVVIPAGATTFLVRAMTATQAFPPQTKYWNKMGVTWTLSGQYGNAGLSARLGATDHVVYVTLKDPIDLRTSKAQAAAVIQSKNAVYLTALHLGVSSDGAATEKDAFVNTWNLFKGTKVTNWKGDPLQYYGDSGFKTATTLSGLLQTKDGQCNTHAGLLAAAAAVNGIAADPVWAKQKKGLYFLVKDFKFNPQVRGPHYAVFSNWPTMKQEKDEYGDLKSLNTLAGQNTMPPTEKVFNNHVFVVAKFQNAPDYYDPSYGGTYTDADDFQARAIAGVLFTPEGAFSQPKKSRRFQARLPIVDAFKQGEFALFFDKPFQR